MKQFVVLMMTLLMLGREAVCQQAAVTFDQAVTNWQSNSCVFPDKSLYKSADENVLSALEQCHILEHRPKTDSPDDKFRSDLCQAFYMMSTSVCTREDLQPFARGCLNPEILKNVNPFAREDVCSYVFEGQDNFKYFTFMQSRDVCSRNCGSNMNSMKKICELYAFIIYQFEHRSACDPSVEKQPRKEEKKPVDESNQDKSSTPFVTTEPVTTPRTPVQTNNTSTTQIRLVNTSLVASKLPETANSNGSINTASNNSKLASAVTAVELPIESSAPVKDDSKASLPSQGNWKTVSSIGEAKTSVASKEPSKTSDTSKEESDTPVSSKDGQKASVSGQDNSKTSVSGTGEVRTPLSSLGAANTSAVSKEESKTTESLLISKITAAATQETVPTETTALQNKEATNRASKQNTTPEADEDEGEGYHRGGEPPEDSSEQEDMDQTKIDKGTKKIQNDSQGKLPGVAETGRKKQPDLEKKKTGVALGNDYDDTESSPGSGHFLAYFLTAVVICISGYVIYHNKQKILAFIIEGRNGGRAGRQRSKDVKYSQLKSNVEEVLPSLDQTATGKNFVY